MPHAGLMFAARITLAHFSVSSLMNRPNPAADSAKGVAPSSESRATFSVPLRQRLLTVGDFLTALPKSLSHRLPGLKALPIVLPSHEYPMGIVTMKNRTLSPVVELFIKRLRQFRTSLT
jgi:hypothetical protein